MYELSNSYFTPSKKVKPMNSMKKLNTIYGLMDFTVQKPAKSNFYSQTSSEKSGNNKFVGKEKPKKCLAWMKLPSEVENPFSKDKKDVKVQKKEVPRLPIKRQPVRKGNSCSPNLKTPTNTSFYAGSKFTDSPMARYVPAPPRGWLNDFEINISQQKLKA